MMRTTTRRRISGADLLGLVLILALVLFFVFSKVKPGADPDIDSGEMHDAATGRSG